MNLSAPFINRPVMTTFVMLGILIAGWMSFTHLPVSDLPTIEHPQIQVRSGYPGATPENVLNAVTIPLEKELAHVKGIQEMSSQSSAGSSHITLKFDLSKNMDEAIRDVQDALNHAEKSLPSDLDPWPTYSRQRAGQGSIMYILLTSTTHDIGELHDYADAYIIPKLTRIEGIAEVSAFGKKKAFWLRLNPDLMAAREVAFNDVIGTIKRKTSQAPLGEIQTTTKNISIELAGKVRHIEEIENTFIGNSLVRIKDIGTISAKSPNEQEFFFVTPTQRTKTLILGIQKIGEANTVAISKQVREELKLLEKNLPSSISMNLWFDKALWIHESIVDVQYSLLFAFLLVVFVIYLSLGRISDALIPSLALPLSLFGTFIAMYLLHFSLDLLSLLALTLSVGFVVDDAIVVLENIVRHQESGETPLNASLIGSKQICFTVLSMTLSLIAVFVPLLFMGGMNGRLFREFSVTLAASIVVSGFISLSLTPMLCSRFLSTQAAPNKLQRAITNINDACVSLYGRSLNFCFRWPKSILLLACCSVVAIVPLSSFLKVDLLPSEDRGFVLVLANLPPGTDEANVKTYQKQIETIIREKPYVENFLDINHSSSLTFSVRLLPIDKRPPQKEVIADLQSILDKIPGLQTFIQGYQLVNLDFDWGSGGQYKYHIQGNEFAEIDEGAKNLVKKLQGDSLVTYVQNPHKNDTPKLSIDVDETYAHLLGFGKEQIQTLLQNAYGKSSIGKIQRGISEEKIYMEMEEKFQKNPKTLSKLSISSSQGILVPLKAVASWKETLGPPKLQRRDQVPSTFVRFALDPQISSHKGLEHVERIASETLPDNLHGHMGFAAQAVSSAMNHTLLLLIAAAVVMYIVLGILYESFIHPLTILSSLPFASLGGILTLLAFSEPISIFSAVGFLLLIGIVKKNGIMMIDYALEAQKRGLSSQNAIFEGCLKRFRPIMMTTIAAIMGALPIAIGFGDGAEMRKGLGLVIVGGLLFAQILTLFITPLLYLFFEQVKNVFRLRLQKYQHLKPHRKET